ncbi:hypothetical protein HQ529_06410 [Candidatus Woesearchaeota archaeon]|nr:hypothetical protein [Candidatus Woesearchaeota archaeon]
MNIKTLLQIILGFTILYSTNATAQINQKPMNYWGYFSKTPFITVSQGNQTNQDEPDKKDNMLWMNGMYYKNGTLIYSQTAIEKSDLINSLKDSKNLSNPQGSIDLVQIMRNSQDYTILNLFGEKGIFLDTRIGGSLFSNASLLGFDGYYDQANKNISTDSTEVDYGENDTLTTSSFFTNDLFNDNLGASVLLPIWKFSLGGEYHKQTSGDKSTSDIDQNYTSGGFFISNDVSDLDLETMISGMSFGFNNDIISIMLKKKEIKNIHTLFMKGRSKGESSDIEFRDSYDSTKTNETDAELFYAGLNSIFSLKKMDFLTGIYYIGTDDNDHSALLSFGLNKSDWTAFGFFNNNKYTDEFGEKVNNNSFSLIIGTNPNIDLEYRNEIDKWEEKITNQQQAVTRAERSREKYNQEKNRFLSDLNEEFIFNADYTKGDSSNSFNAQAVGDLIDPLEWMINKFTKGLSLNFDLPIMVQYNSSSFYSVDNEGEIIQNWSENLKLGIGFRYESLTGYVCKESIISGIIDGKNRPKIERIEIGISYSVK